MIEIKEIFDKDTKTEICDVILHSLPQWFGVEPSIQEYMKSVRKMPFYAAYDGAETVGFIALEEHNAYTAEISVMGIGPAYHRRGIGRILVEQCIRKAQSSGKSFLTVKTLDESAISEAYARTRQFYRALGFVPLEVFPLHWDKENPCLFMAKYLGKDPVS